MINRDYINFTLLCVSGLLFYCYEFYLRILTGAFEQQIVQYFDISTHLNFSFLISSYNIMYLAMQIPAGILLDRFGSKKILTIATLICGFGNILFIVDKSYGLALLGRLLVGLGSSCAFVGVLKISREYLPARYFSIFASIVISLGTLAAAFSQQISVLLLSYDFSWITIFIFSGLAALPLSLLFYVALSIPHKNAKARVMPDAKSMYLNLVDLVRNKYIWFNGLWAGLFYVPTVVLTSQYGVAYFTSLYGATTYVAAQAITMLLMGWVVCSPLMSLVANVTHKTRYVIIYSGFFSLITLFFMTYFPSSFKGEYSIFLSAFLLGNFLSCQVLVWHIFNKICNKNISALGIALTNMIITAITEIGQLSSGLILDWQAALHAFSTATGFNHPMQLDVLLFFVSLILGIGIFLAFYPGSFEENAKHIIEVQN